MTQRASLAVPAIPRGLFLLSVLYGGMVPLGGFLGAKQVALGPLAVEAGIFPFLTLVALSSAFAELYGKPAADRLVRLGFVPLVVAIALALFVLQLPTDAGMYPPAKEAFPIIVGQSWRMMAAGIAAYGVSVTLNIWLFDRMRGAAGSSGLGAGVRGFIAAALSQIVDTLIFITVSFYGVRPIGDLMLGQMLAKVVLSLVLVPVLIAIFTRLARTLDAKDVPGT
ncbi:queuosine precursor transporter [Tsuneonella mangrovi]|uniref:queuosine precursor transporter n=1 Tax=Tsuneonella mangrovi TaxID=1982042 RepID=UPI000BA27D68|nr:queuosine precursor transporter [Tsuneonella mangrovi]